MPESAARELAPPSSGPILEVTSSRELTEELLSGGLEELEGIASTSAVDGAALLSRSGRSRGRGRARRRRCAVPRQRRWMLSRNASRMSCRRSPCRARRAPRGDRPSDEAPAVPIDSTRSGPFAPPWVDEVPDPVTPYEQRVSETIKLSDLPPDRSGARARARQPLPGGGTRGAVGGQPQLSRLSPRARPRRDAAHLAARPRLLRRAMSGGAPRGSRGVAVEPSEHREHAGLWRHERRLAVRRHRAFPGPNAGVAPGRGGQVRAAPGAAHRQTAGRGSERRPPGRRGARFHQPGQRAGGRAGDLRRGGDHSRLRRVERARSRAGTAAQRSVWRSVLRLPGASQLPAARRPLGHLFRGRALVRADDGGAAVFRWRFRGGVVPAPGRRRTNRRPRA